jgi:hypothetical protein
MERHGLRLRAPNLARELGRRLDTIDRRIAGFEDFTDAGTRAIEPGAPAASLLYHALASPNVHPTASGRPARAAAYPTLDDLDVIENYIYSLARADVDLDAEDDDGQLAIAVFAYHYRPGTHGPHRYHADLAFSRTGIARVGTRPPRYDPVRRCFWPVGRGSGVAVMPARYGVFLAKLREPKPTDPILGRRREDTDRTFAFPVHKLFSGTECLPTCDLSVEFAEYHRSEKLQRVHRVGRVELSRGFRMDDPPFIRDSRTTRDLVDLEEHGATTLIVPRPAKQLVRYAEQRNDESNRREIVSFTVPEETRDPETDEALNRYATTLSMAVEGLVRNAPEYVNIRHEVIGADAARPRIRDLNRLSDAEFKRRLRNGGYRAAHFVDDTCDGVVAAFVRGLPRVLPERSAFSLVTPPDFFPLADQTHIAEWTRALADPREHFEQGAPDPLSEGRRPVNPQLHRPGFPGSRAFAADDETVTAVVGMPPLSRRDMPPPSQKTFVSFLPEAASNEFAPGWEVSLAGDDDASFYASYGLGSPFPEDVKLCAALNSFWPAVAPDASRTFRDLMDGVRLQTAIPMLDAELGYHRQHPKVRDRSVRSRPGWDGEYGPFFERRAGRLWVNYADLSRSDYVTNTMNGGFDLRLFAEVDSPELIARMNALRWCIRTITPGDDVVSDTEFWLVTAEKIARWEAVTPNGAPALQGPGYLFVFAAVGVESSPVQGQRLRRRLPVRQTYTCHLTGNRLFHRAGQGRWRRAR